MIISYPMSERITTKPDKRAALRHGWGGNLYLRKKILEERIADKKEQMTHTYREEKFGAGEGGVPYSSNSLTAEDIQKLQELQFQLT